VDWRPEELLPPLLRVVRLCHQEVRHDQAWVHQVDRPDQVVFLAWESYGDPVFQV